MTPAPPAHVRAAFGAVGRAHPLPGGQRTVWRVGDVVLKRSDLSAEAVAWQADVLSRVDGGAGVRVAPPAPTASERWLVEGWSAWRFLRGRPAGDRWPEVVAAGRALHEALRGTARPSSLDTRDDVWARADRLVWDLDAPAPGAPFTAAFGARRPVAAPDQLVHGDLTGNVLLQPGADPAVIDLSPYWHPAGWAAAVVAADAVLAGAAPDVVDVVRAGERDAADEFDQLFLRAVLFRLVTTHLVRRETGRGDLVGPGVDPAARLALELVSR